ncbi:MAG: LuxR C-terminal-related transcriptional regulator [Eubacteriales bacterium]|nr:LuxR C-terminal-related transcriptional regulator [Eubacteriales bacterium]
MNQKKSTILTTIFIALCFSWTGSSYISWLHQLKQFYDVNFVYIVTESWGGYLPQIAGILTWSYFVATNKKWAFTIPFLTFLCGLDALFVMGCIFPSQSSLVLCSGFIISYLHGILCGFYLTLLAMMVPKQHRGLAFATGYAIGSIASYLLSLPDSGNFLAGKAISVVYLLMIAATIGMLPAIQKQIAQLQTDIPQADLEQSVANATRQPQITDKTTVFRMLLAPAALIFLVTLMNQFMNAIPAISYLNGTIGLEFSRAFYAIGLLLAGYINDKNRRFGPLLCLLALVFSLISLGLYNTPNVTLLLAIIGYITLAFPIVYRVVSFADATDYNKTLLFLAPVGLAIGRLGEATGAYFGLMLTEHHIATIVTLSLLFILISILVYTINMASVVITETEMSVAVETESQPSLSFEEFYDLSKRECEIFDLILKKASNPAIAESLFVSENTVKFHVKNILHKTDCKNRKELIQKAEAYQSE